MHRIVGGMLALTLELLPVSASGQAQPNPPTPAEQYKSLVKEYQTAASGGGGSDEDRKKRIARVGNRRGSLAQRFLDLAEKHPADPIAVDALIQAVWMVNNNAFPTGDKDSPGAKAMTLLLQNHIGSDKLGPICLRI